MYLSLCDFCPTLTYCQVLPSNRSFLVLTTELDILLGAQSTSYWLDSRDLPTYIDRPGTIEGLQVSEPPVIMPPPPQRVQCQMSTFDKSEFTTLSLVPPSLPQGRWNTRLIEAPVQYSEDGCHNGIMYVLHPHPHSSSTCRTNTAFTCLG